MNTQEQAEFENWLRGLPHFPKSPLAWAYERDTLGNYCNNRVDDMWHGWQARAMLAASPVVQKPLTDEQIDAIVARSCKKDSSHLDAARVARAIEAAHGIGGQQP